MVVTLDRTDIELQLVSFCDITDYKRAYFVAYKVNGQSHLNVNKLITKIIVIIELN